MGTEDFQKLIGSLREIFDAQCLIHFATEHVDITLPLRETQKEAKLKEVNIRAKSNQIFAIQLDTRTNTPICKYFNKSAKKINKTCDFLIFTIFEETPYMLLIEMKSEVPKGYKEQFHNSLLFVEYVKMILSEYYGCDCSNFKAKLFLFYYRKSGKNEAIIYEFGAKKITDKVRGIGIHKKSFSEKYNNSISLQELFSKGQ